MIGNAARTWILLALMTGATAGWSQQEVATEAQPEQAVPATDEQETADGSTATAANPDQDDTAPAGDSPFDYQASEEISEDLSVSFPVDI